MIKRYFNTAERTQVITIAGLIGAFQEIISTWASLKRSPLVLKYLRAARTFAAKALDEVMQQVTPEEVQKVGRLAKTTELVLHYDGYTEGPVRQKYTIDDDERAQDVAECVIQQHCIACDGHDRECWVRSLLYEWGVPPYREVTDGCQYSYKEVIG